MSLESMPYREASEAGCHPATLAPSIGHLLSGQDMDTDTDTDRNIGNGNGNCIDHRRGHVNVYLPLTVSGHVADPYRLKLTL